MEVGNPNSSRLYSVHSRWSVNRKVLMLPKILLHFWQNVARSFVSIALHRIRS